MDTEQPSANGTSSPEPAPSSPRDTPPVVVTGTGRSHRQLLWIGLAVVLVILAGVGGWVLHDQLSNTAVHETATNTQQTTSSSSDSNKTEGLVLDATKNYGNLYANGILPVGDSKYVSDAAKQGYVYVCSQYAQNLAHDQGGAQSRGPWFTNNNQSYDITKKVKVSGHVVWQPSFANSLSGTTRTVTTNDLPSHYTGVYPISSSDPAYTYDRNPNSIKAQSYTYTLAANPTYGSPNCMGGEAGIMLTGVALFNAFDAGGRDAGAWEVQDGCGGHPQKDGEYHYHTLSSCITDIGVRTVIGFALDGFPITGPQISSGNILTTKDLDECHGITSQITLDGKIVTMYHYVMTQDFPYSVSCFRSNATQPPELAAHP